jgi:hypothetical protein
MQNVPPLVQESPGLTGCVAGHLLHPCLIRMARDPCQSDTATLQMNEEQDVIRHQATPCEDLDGEEIDASQHRHMRLNKLLPRRGLAPFRRRRNAVALQNIPHGLVRDLIAEVG